VDWTRQKEEQIGGETGTQTQNSRPKTEQTDSRETHTHKHNTFGMQRFFHPERKSFSHFGFHE
jgi:hypothetical protein